MPDEFDGSALMDALQAGPTDKTPALPPPPSEDGNALMDALQNPPTQHEMLARERQYLQNAPEKPGAFLARTMLPWGATAIDVSRATKYTDAKARFDAGEARNDDLEQIAAFEHLRDLRANYSTGERILEGAAHIPGLVAEAGVASALTAPLQAVRAAPALAPQLALGGARLAASTAATPSLYLPAAAERSVEQGGSVVAPQNLGPAFAMGAAQNAVLGSLNKVGGAVPTVAGRIAVRTATGMAEQQVVDAAASAADNVLPDAYKFKTNYGLIGELLKKDGHPLQRAAVEVANFAVFSAMHGGEPRRPLEAFGKATDAMEKAGYTPADAARVLEAGPTVPLPEAVKEPLADWMNTKQEVQQKADFENAKSPAAPPEPERYYRTPDSKAAGPNVDAAIRELAGKEFAGKWFSRTREGNEGYFTPGKVQFEFSNEHLGSASDVVERREKDVSIGGKSPMYMHPGLTAIRFRGDAAAPEFGRLKDLITDANKERQAAGIHPIDLEAVPSGAKPATFAEQLTPAERTQLAKGVGLSSAKALATIDPKTLEALAKGVVESRGQKTGPEPQKPASYLAEPAKDVQAGPLPSDQAAQQPTAPPDRIVDSGASGAVSEPTSRIPSRVEQLRARLGSREVSAPTPATARPAPGPEAVPARIERLRQGGTFDVARDLRGLKRYSPEWFQVIKAASYGTGTYGKLAGAMRSAAELRTQKAVGEAMGDIGGQPEPVAGQKAPDRMNDRVLQYRLDSFHRQVETARGEPTPENLTLAAEILGRLREMATARGMNPDTLLDKEFPDHRELRALYEQTNGRNPAAPDVKLPDTLDQVNKEIADVQAELAAHRARAEAPVRREGIDAVQAGGEAAAAPTAGEGVARPGAAESAGVPEAAGSAPGNQPADQAGPVGERPAGRDQLTDYSNVSYEDTFRLVHVGDKREGLTATRVFPGHQAYTDHDMSTGQVRQIPADEPTIAFIGDDGSAGEMGMTDWMARKLDPKQQAAADRVLLAERKAAREAAKQAAKKSPEELKAIRMANLQKNPATMARAEQRAGWEREAADLGVSAKDLHGTAADIVEQQESHRQELQDLLDEARSTLSRMFGGDWKLLAANSARGSNRGEDWIKGLDVAAQSAAAAHRGFFPDFDPETNTGNLDVPGRLLELLREGNPPKLTEKEAYEQALEQIAQHVAVSAAREARQAGYSPAAAEEARRLGTDIGTEEALGDAAEPEPTSRTRSRFDFDPFDFSGESPTGNAAPERAEPVDHVKEAVESFVKEEGGYLEPDKIVDYAKRQYEHLKGTFRYLGDEAYKLGGGMFPALTRLHGPSGEAAARYISAKTWARQAAPDYIDRVLPKNATQEAARAIGAAFTELQLRHTRQAYQAIANDPKRPMNERIEAQGIARDVVSLVGGKNSPFLNETEFRNAANSPAVNDAMDKWIKDFVPVMDDLYRRAAGMDVSDPIHSFTQIKDFPVNLKGIGPGEEATAGTVIPLGGGRGNLKNPKQYSSVFANQRKGNAPGGYDVDIREMIRNSLERAAEVAAKRELYDTMKEAGIARQGESGKPNEGWRELPNVFTGPEKSLYVREEAYKDVRQALAVDLPWKRLPGAALLTKASLMSTLELAYHAKNQITFLMQDGVRPTDLFKNAIGYIQGKPEIAARLTELARIGALKGEGRDAGMLLGAKYKSLDPTYHTSRLLDGLGDVMRLTASDAFDRLAGTKPDLIVDAFRRINAGKPLAVNTETAKRDFINQLGQYNKLAQQSFVVFLRDTGIGDFATAGTNYAVQGLRTLTLSPGVQATTPTAAVAMRAGRLGKMVGVMATVALANYLAWGRVDGDDATPTGSIKLGKDGNKTVSYDLADLIGLKRGLRSVGLLAVLEGQRKGEDANKTATKAVDQAAMSALHPMIGPPVEFAREAVTGKDAMGYPIAPQKDHKNRPAMNLLGAAERANPLAKAGIEAYENKGKPPAEQKSTGEQLNALLGPFGAKYRKK